MRFNPLDHPIIFAEPQRLVMSSWMQHVPFGMYLVERLKPRLLVELGTHHGASYCAFCQAVTTLQTGTRCAAVDNWQGDEHSGVYGFDVFEDLRRHHDSRYGAFSQLLRMSFDEALSHFEERSIDLLHIDGYHTYDAVRHDFETWHPKLSDRAVVLFHDIDEREQGFGVWRLWEELKTKYPSFEMSHAHGLGVLAVGNERVEGLNELLDATPDECAAIRECFRSVGSRLVLQVELAAQARDHGLMLSAKEELILEKDAQLGSRDGALREKDAVLGILRQRDREATSHMDELTVIAAERALANRELTDQLRQARDEQKQLEMDRQQLEVDRERLDTHVSALRSELDAALQGGASRVSRRHWWPFIGSVFRRGDSGPTGVNGQADLAFALRSPLPRALHTGQGIAMPLRGWCYSQRGLLRSLAITVNGEPQPVSMHSHCQLDVLANQCPNVDRTGNSLLSGFFAVVTFRGVRQVTLAKLALRAELDDGSVAVQLLGELELRPGYDAAPVSARWRDSSTPRVAICMTTYNPPRELFSKQVASIRTQTHPNWMCIVSDDTSSPSVQAEMRGAIAGDERFVFVSHGHRVGFYRNVERCLRYVPADAEFVALSDHDDEWDADKLEVLLGAFSEGTHLAYSDMRIVDRSGRVVSNTFWVTRENNHTDLATMLFANTITGAASMFRSSLLPDVLPLPEKVVDAYHDHWIGLTSLMKGDVAFVNRPLHSYYQHGSNVIGYKQEGPAPGVLNGVKALVGACRNRSELRARARALLGEASDAYPMIVQKILLAETLLLRHPGASSSKRRVLRSIAGIRRSLAPLVMQSVRAMVWRRPSLGLERYHLRVALGTKLRNAYFRAQRRRLLAMRLQMSHAHSAQALSSQKMAGVTRASVWSATRYGNTEWVAHNISPLRLRVSDDYPERVNVLMATVDFRYVFGGYIAMLNLIRRLHRGGYRTRIVLLEKTDVDLEGWRDQIRQYAGLEGLFDDIEVIYRFDRSLPVEVSRRDAFVATSCWSAHVAHQAVRELKRTRFVFLIQEYEPVFVPKSSIHALFEEAYTFPQYALFSTEMLRDYFRMNRIGVYADSQGHGDAQSTSFENAVLKASVDRGMLQRRMKRLLFYARPEPHAARNMFELGMMSLAELLRRPEFDVSRWSFHGIGSIDLNVRLELAPRVELHLVPRMSPQKYIEMLATFDVGLALMLTPHPSLVPLEMAGAGLWTVTNSFANKTPQRLEAVSSNLIVVPPTVSGIGDGLRRAIRSVDDLAGRIEGSNIRWPTDWEAALNDEVMARMKSFLAEL